VKKCQKIEAEIFTVPGWAYKWELIINFNKTFFEQFIFQNNESMGEEIDKTVERWKLKIEDIDAIIKKSLENSIVEKLIKE